MGRKTEPKSTAKVKTGKPGQDIESTHAKDGCKDSNNRASKRSAKKENFRWNANYVDDLADELAALGLRIRKITADGNCFFRALGDQLRGDEGMHAELRSKIMNFVKDHQEDYAPFIEDDESFDKYVSRMRKDGIWAGNIELVAASHCLQVNITIYQANQPRWAIKNFDEGSVPMLHLSYHDGQHYNSVRMVNDPGTGLPVPIILSGDGLVKKKAAAAGQGPWAGREVQRVAASTACDDGDLVRRCLEQARGDVDLAIEKVIEYLSNMPEEPEAQATHQVPLTVVDVIQEPHKYGSEASHSQPASCMSPNLSASPKMDATGQAASQINGIHIEAQDAAVHQLDHGLQALSLSEQHEALFSDQPDYTVAEQSDRGHDHVPLDTQNTQSATAGVSQSLPSESGQVAGNGACTQQLSSSQTLAEDTQVCVTTQQPDTSHEPASGTCESADGAGASKQTIKSKKEKKQHTKPDKGATKAPGRNRDCPCGSKKKYKNCCGVAAAAAARRKAAQGSDTDDDDHGGHSSKHKGKHASEEVAGKAAQIGVITI